MKPSMSQSIGSSLTALRSLGLSSVAATTAPALATRKPLHLDVDTTCWRDSAPLQEIIAKDTASAVTSLRVHADITRDPDSFSSEYKRVAYYQQALIGLRRSCSNLQRLDVSFTTYKRRGGHPHWIGGETEARTGFPVPKLPDLSRWESLEACRLDDLATRHYFRLLPKTLRELHITFGSEVSKALDNDHGAVRFPSLPHLQKLSVHLDGIGEVHPTLAAWIADRDQLQTLALNLDNWRGDKAPAWEPLELPESLRDLRLRFRSLPEDSGWDVETFGESLASSRISHLTLHNCLMPSEPREGALLVLQAVAKHAPPSLHHLALSHCRPQPEDAAALAALPAMHVEIAEEGLDNAAVQPDLLW